MIDELLRLKKIIAMTAEKMGATIENADCQELATEIDKHFILTPRALREWRFCLTCSHVQIMDHVRFYHGVNGCTGEIIHVQEKERF